MIGITFGTGGEVLPVGAEVQIGHRACVPLERGEEPGMGEVALGGFLDGWSRGCSRFGRGLLLGIFLLAVALS